MPKKAVKAARAEQDVAAPAPLTSSSTTDLAAAVAQCDGATSWAELERAFTRHVVPVLHALLRLPLVQPLADDVSPTDCCDAAVTAARRLVVKYDDVRYLTYRACTSELKGATPSAVPARGEGLRRRTLTPNTKRGAEADEASATLVVINVYCLLYGVTFTATRQGEAVDAATLRFPFLAEEKRAIERSEAYANSNAAERRATQLKTVLGLFTERGRKHEFSALWTAFTGSEVPASLRLHFLTSAATRVLPHLTKPVALSDYLTDCFTRGGLTAVLALDGLFVLMVDHGLEYPSFYDKLYSLVTPDAFSSRHRNQLFRLVNLALTSVRVSASIVAAFIKRICRVLLLSPTPTYYFALSFVRQLFQRHPNCLPLIHRTDGAPELFEGKDPYLPFENSLDKCKAMESTLWELSILERHYQPAVNLMVSAYASPAHDLSELKFDKTFGRLLAQELTRARPDEPGVISYKAPKEGLLAADNKEPGFAGVFTA